MYILHNSRSNGIAAITGHTEAELYLQVAEGSRVIRSATGLWHKINKSEAGREQGVWRPALATLTAAQTTTD